MGTPLTCFQTWGNTPWVRQDSNNNLKGRRSVSSHIFVIRTEISSQPLALFVFKDRIIFKMFSIEIEKPVSSEMLGRDVTVSSLPVSIVLHCCLK